MEQFNDNKIKIGYSMLQAQYNKFCCAIQQQDAKTIYDSNYKIAVIENFKDCLIENHGGEIANAVLSAFAEHRVSLEMLYNVFLDSENASITSYADILEFFEEILKTIYETNAQEE